VAGLTVDKGVSFLFGGMDQEVTFGLQVEEETPEAPDPDAPPDEPAGAVRNPDEEWLDSVWEANSKKTLLNDVATNGGVCGHFFVRLYETGARLDQALPRIANLDPSYVTPVFMDDDYEVVLGYKIQFPTIWRGQLANRRTLVEPEGLDDLEFDPQEVDRWLITHQVALGAGEWVNLGTDETWDYPFAPIVDAKNLPKPNEYWGRSDLDGGVGRMNGALNRVMSSMARILRLHGHPKPWASGVTPEQIAILIQGTDRIITLPDGVTLNQLEMTGDLGGMVEFYRQLKSAFHETAKNPQVDPEKLGAVGGLSGVALRILYQPLLEQTGQKRGTYGDWLKVVNQRLLMVGRKTPAPLVVGWPDPIPLEYKETAEGLVAARELGLSQETALERLGHDPEQEAERRTRDSTTPGAAAAALMDGLLNRDPAGEVQPEEVLV
jgi:hypothetical protein